jgi:hypothetical protein
VQRYGGDLVEPGLDSRQGPGVAGADGFSVVLEQDGVDEAELPDRVRDGGDLGSGVGAGVAFVWIEAADGAVLLLAVGSA